MSGALLLTVTELCGDAVVLGGVHRVEFRDGALTIRGVSLDRARAILGVLASESLQVARLGGIVPQALPPVAAEVPAARPALVPVPPQASPPPAPAVEETPPWEPPSAPAGGVPASPAPTERADPPPPPATAQGANAGGDAAAIPNEIRAAKTLRPVCVWLCEQADALNKTVTVDTMLVAVQRLQPYLDAGLRTIPEAELRERVQRTLTGIGRA